MGSMTLHICVGTGLPCSGHSPQQVLSCKDSSLCGVGMLEGQLFSSAILEREGPNRLMGSHVVVDCEHWENSRST